MIRFYQILRKPFYTFNVRIGEGGSAWMFIGFIILILNWKKRRDWGKIRELNGSPRQKGFVATLRITAVSVRFKGDHVLFALPRATSHWWELDSGRANVRLSQFSPAINNAETSLALSLHWTVMIPTTSLKSGFTMGRLKNYFYLMCSSVWHWNLVQNLKLNVMCETL